MIWVDDIVAAYHASLWREFKAFIAEYNTTYEINVLGPTVVFSGIQVERDRQAKTVKLHQTNYKRDMWTKFKDYVPSGLTAVTPVPYVKSTSDSNHFENISFAATDEERAKMKDLPFMSLYASLLFNMCMTGPDVAYPLANLGRYITDPSLAAWNALCRILLFVHKHETDGITYGGRISIPAFFMDASEYRRNPSLWNDSVIANLGLYILPDASWKVSRAFAGFAVMLGNAAVDWACKLVRVLAHSSMEMEIAAGCFAGKRYMLIRSVINEIHSRRPSNVQPALKLHITGPIIFCIDNSATKDHTQDEGVKPKTEHFLRWQYYLRWLVSMGYGVVFWVATKNQPVDFMTKIVDQTTFLRGRAVVMNIAFGHAMYIILDPSSSASSA